MARLLNLSAPLTQPPFTSAIIIELRKSVQDDKYFVQVYYKNNVDEEPIQLEEVRVGVCDYLCPIEEFFQLNSAMEIDDVTGACRSSKNKKKTYFSCVRCRKIKNLTKSFPLKEFDCN